MPAFTRKDSPNPIVNSYKTKDGRWLFLNMLQPDKFWPDLCRCIGHPELIEEERFKDGMSRFQNRVECVQALEAIFASRTLNEWRTALADCEGVWAPMQNALELHDDPQALANDYLATIDRGDGKPFTLVANPVQFDETAPVLRPAPDLGQHTEEILLELGMTWDDLAKYKEAGAIS
jgi:formyl-CoA transferase